MKFWKRSARAFADEGLPPLTLVHPETYCCRECCDWHTEGDQWFELHFEFHDEPVYEVKKGRAWVLLVPWLLFDAEGKT